jgi:hypothetical protein
VSGLPQGGKVDLQQTGNTVIMIKAQSVSVRNSDQKKIKKNLQGPEISQKTTGDQPMIDPAEGALDLSETFGMENPFDLHGRHPPVGMILFCSRQIDFTI